MRRRPMELWWIALFGIFQALFAFNTYQSTSVTEGNVIAAYGIGCALTAILLLKLSATGRFAAAVMIGVEGCHQIDLLLGAIDPPVSSVAVHLVFASFCMWMLFYLHSGSTARLCGGGTVSFTRRPGLDIGVLDLLEVGLGFGAAAVAYHYGADPWLTACTGMSFYIAYGLLLQDWVHNHWVAAFARTEAGFPARDAGNWRAACRALVRQDLEQARTQITSASNEAREHPASSFFMRMLEWHELVRRTPVEGRDCLRRAAYDHDWKPSLSERTRLTDHVEGANADAIRKLVDERAELIDDLVACALNPRSFFYKQACDHLGRITGETFQFNAPESWAEWWDASRGDWSGDAGMVSIVARLVRMDADTAAHSMARRICGRAEEPMLKELTGQVLFLNRMQKAIREHQGVDSFIKQPHRMLLVPELSDAVGLLHADSQLLENMGMTLHTVQRRLHLRVPLVDYIGKIWQRYPNELGADMPWVLKTLTDKNLGVLRARARFNAWWPAARNSFQRHDHAVTEGLAAFAAGDNGRSEKAFRSALVEQPRELSSRYNLALCLMRREAFTDAARLLQELTRLEPKESYWWLALGEMHRNINRSADAHAAFRRALELGAAAPRVAWHRGLTFARDQKDADAIKQLDRVLGTNPSASKIDALASALESEGLWKLAGHYREEAFRRGLDGDQGEFDEREGAGDFSA